MLKQAKMSVVAYALFAAMAVGVIVLRLGPGLLAGLFSYMLLDISFRLLCAWRVPRFVSRWTSLLLLLLAITGGTWMIGLFVRDTLSTVPQIAVAVVPKIIELSYRYEIPLPFENVIEFRDMIVVSLRDNIASVSKATGIVTKETLRVLLGIVVAILFFMNPGKPCREENLCGSLSREISGTILRFMLGFEKVLGAQVIIALINTVLTSAYLLWAGIPHIAFLIPATFFLGVIPIVGNIGSNVLIIGTALTVSPKLAVMSLGFLVFIHTLEHFLNSRIIGERIEAPMWLTLLSILVGELVLGVPGIILAPTIIYYAREEMRSLPAATV